MKNNLYFFLTALLALGAPCAGSAQTISTVAGSTTTGYSGDGSAATAATMDMPRGTAVDASGNIYIADANNRVIRKVNTSGIISTFAGTGVMGYSGDGAAATAAKFTLPVDVATDATGNVYIVDNGSHNIRMVNSAGVISTVAGMPGMAGSSGDGAAATAAMLSAPQAVTLDATGNMYIADYGNNTIRKVTTAGIISTFAGTAGTPGYGGDAAAATAAKLNNPCGVAVDAITNRVYISDAGNYRIRVVYNTDGKIYTFAGNGAKGYTGDGLAAGSAQLDSLTGIAVDAVGSVYAADKNRHCVRRISISSLIISTLAGTGISGTTGDGGPANMAKLNNPTDVAFDATGNMYIADSYNNRIRKTTALPAISILGGTTGICTATTSTLSNATTGGTWSSSTTTVATVGSSSGVVTGVAAGTATITYKTPTDGALKVVTVIACGSHVAVNNVQATKNDMKVYPNPANGTFSIQVSSAIDEAVTVTITNIVGAKVKLFTTGTNKQTDVQLDAPSGIYFISATSQNGRWSEKLTLVH